MTAFTALNALKLYGAFCLDSVFYLVLYSSTALARILALLL